MNYRLLIQYDGTNFHGWQIQARERTVQGEITQALRLLFNEDVHVSGSGRTDAGVHAEGQVANFHLSKFFAAEKLRGALNGNLKRDVRILTVEEAAADFHARFSATGKTYVYRIINARVMSPFWMRYAMHEARPLDLEKMQKAAELLLGEHDWTAFSSARSDTESRVRKISQSKFEIAYDARAQTQILEFTISANGFLRYIVRSLVGTLLEVGRGRKSLDAIKMAIETGEKSFTGTTAPACGLTLLKVSYESNA